MTTSYLSISEFPGDGVTTEWEFNFAGGYISRDHVLAYIKSDVGVITPYDITSAFISDFKVSVTPAVPIGSTLRVYRDTPREEPIVNFTGGSNFTEANLDLLARQTIFAVAEAFDAGAYAAVNDLLGAAGAALEAALTSQAANAASEVSANGSAVTATAQAVIAALRATESANSALISAANNDAARAKNAIINGRMWLVPDGVTSWTNPATGTYMLGLWYLTRSGAFAFNAASAYEGPEDRPQVLRFTCTTAAASLAASDVLSSEEIIEASTATQFRGKTFTVRGTIYSDVAGVIPVYIRDYGATTSYVIPVTVAAGVYTDFEHTVVGGLAAGVSWGVGTAGGFRIGVNFASGATYKAPTGGAWHTGNYVGLTGQINGVGAVGRKVAFTNMSMVLGTAKPDAEDFSIDRIRMQRWYQVVRVVWTGYSGGVINNLFTYPIIPMRQTPAATVSSATGTGAVGTPTLFYVDQNYVTGIASGTGVGAFSADISAALSARY